MEQLTREDERRFTAVVVTSVAVGMVADMTEFRDVYNIDPLVELRYRYDETTDTVDVFAPADQWSAHLQQREQGVRKGKLRQLRELLNIWLLMVFCFSLVMGVALAAGFSPLGKTFGWLVVVWIFLGVFGLFFIPGTIYTAVKYWGHRSAIIKGKEGA